MIYFDKDQVVRFNKDIYRTKQKAFTGTNIFNPEHITLYNNMYFATG